MSEVTLSEHEQRCLSLLAEAATIYHHICNEPREDSDGDSAVAEAAEEDWAEASAHFTALRDALMNQAAARIYPSNFRLLGGVQS